MSAYSMPIDKPTCATCGKSATEIVYNRYNSRVGSFCKRDAAAMIRRLDRAEEERHERQAVEGR